MSPISKIRRIEALERVTEERDDWKSAAQRVANLFDPLKALTSPAALVSTAQGAKNANASLRAERDAALAACAEMRAALELLANSPDHGEDCDGEECGRCKGTGVLGDMTCDTCGGDTFVLTVQCVAHCAAKESARKALSSTAGKGWVSPEEHQQVLSEVASQRERATQAETKLAEMRAALEQWGIVRWTDDDEYGKPPRPNKQHRCRECDGITTADRPIRHAKACTIGRALSTSAGRGWVSPEEHAKVVAVVQEASMRIHAALIWGFDPNTAVGGLVRAVDALIEDRNARVSPAAKAKHGAK